MLGFQYCETRPARVLRMRPLCRVTLPSEGRAPPEGFNLFRCGLQTAIPLKLCIVANPAPPVVRFFAQKTPLGDV